MGEFLSRVWKGHWRKLVDLVEVFIVEGEGDKSPREELCVSEEGERMIDVPVNSMEKLVRFLWVGGKCTTGESLWIWLIALRFLCF